MPDFNVNRPVGADGKTMHCGFEDRPDAVTPEFLLVGDPQRAKMIADKFLSGVEMIGDRRNMWSFRGMVRYSHGLPSGAPLPMTVVTTGMGGPSAASMVMKEVADCGGRTGVSVGSCSTFWEDVEPGDVAVATGAVLLGATSHNWAPVGFPAVPDARLVCMLEDAAQELGIKAHLGLEATTDDFWEGQARSLHPDGWLPPHILAQHEWLSRLHVLYYAMEGDLLSWVQAHGHLFTPRLRLARVAAIFGSRVTGNLRYEGEEAAAKLAIHALRASRQHPFAR